MLALKEILENSSLVFVVLLLGALSGLISERAGIVNLGIEGMMTIGALVFAVFAKNWGVKLGNWSQILAIMVAGLTGAVFSLLHAFACINLKANQIISGVAINILAAAIAIFVVQLPGNHGLISFTNSYNSLNNGISPFFNVYLLLGLTLLMIVIFTLKYTKWGLRHIATGENPYAVDAAGISVAKKRYSAVLLAGVISAIAGAIFTIYSSNTFRGSVNGNGFIALAILIFGQWRLPLLVLGALLFSVIETAAGRITYISGVPSIIANSKDLLNTLPFAISLLALVFTSKKSNAPKALGQPFYKSLR